MAPFFVTILKNEQFWGVVYLISIPSRWDIIGGGNNIKKCWHIQKLGLL